MRRILRLYPKFVKAFPEVLEQGVLYVSVEYATVAHSCCCGCGSRVITPLSPKDWKMTYDGESVSLTPSIGNWSYPCQSHYWIRDNGVVWARHWSREEVREAREAERSSHDRGPAPGYAQRQKHQRSGWREVLKRWWQ